MGVSLVGLDQVLRTVGRYPIQSIAVAISTAVNFWSTRNHAPNDAAAEIRQIESKRLIFFVPYFNEKRKIPNTHPETIHILIATQIFADTQTPAAAMLCVIVHTSHVYGCGLAAPALIARMYGT